MRTVLRPVGPQPARVYWVRRMVVLAVLVAAVLLVWSFVSRGAAADADGSGTGADAGATGAEHGTDAEGADAADAADTGTDGAAADGAPAACAPEALTVTLTTDATSYTGDAAPTFTMTFTNTGDTTCVVDAGGSNRSVLVTSGSDRIWSSADCAAEGGTRTLLLAPGAQEQDTVVWPRERSDETCSEGLPAPRPGTYTAVAVLGGAQSGSAVFQLG